MQGGGASAHLEVVQVRGELRAAQRQREQHVPVEDRLHVAVVRRGLRDERLGVLERRLQERDALRVVGLARARLLQLLDAHVARVLDRAPQHVVAHERRDLPALQALLHRAQPARVVRAEADDVVRVRELRVARGRRVRERDGLGDALLEHEVLHLHDVRHVEVRRGAPRAEGARAERERVRPHRERQPGVVRLDAARALVLVLEHALGDRELGAQDQRRLRLAERVQVAVLRGLHDRALELGRRRQGGDRVARVRPVVHHDVRQVVRDPLAHLLHHLPRVVHARVGLGLELVQADEPAERVAPDRQLRAAQTCDEERDQRGLRLALRGEVQRRGREQRLGVREQLERDKRLLQVLRGRPQDGRHVDGFDERAVRLLGQDDCADGMSHGDGAELYNLGIIRRCLHRAQECASVPCELLPDFDSSMVGDICQGLQPNVSGSRPVYQQHDFRHEPCTVV